MNCSYKTNSNQCQHKKVFTPNQVVNDDICNKCQFRSKLIDSGNLRQSLPIITVSGPEIKGPSLAQMGINFTKAMVKQVESTLEGNPTFVPKEIYEARLAICRECPFHNKGRCLHGSCGCYLSNKTKLASSVCPLDPPKWKEYLGSGTLS